MNILLFGAPGAGKGTQSSLLKDKLNMYHLSTGDMFRAAIKNQTEMGLKAKEIIDAGNLVPDDVTIGMVNDVFKEISGQDFILDGFPRTVAQAEALDAMLTKNNIELGKAIFIHVGRELLLGRLTGRRVCSGCGAVYHMEAKPSKNAGVCDECEGELKQRKDDQEDVITTRLQAYEESTMPVIEYYKKAGKYVEVDGVGESTEVYDRVLKHLS